MFTFRQNQCSRSPRIGVHVAPEWVFTMLQNMHTDDKTKLVRAALAGLKAMYRSGYNYKKSGVLLMGLQARESVQATLFDDPATQAKSTSMMHVMDDINQRMGQGSIAIAASGISQHWAMRRERKSPDYTSDWDELPVAG